MRSNMTFKELFENVFLQVILTINALVLLVPGHPGTEEPCWGPIGA